MRWVEIIRQKKLLMVSFDSTIKANLSVGLPFDLHVYKDNSLAPATKYKIEKENPYFKMISSEWGRALKSSLTALPSFNFKD